MSSIIKPVLGSQLELGHPLSTGLVGCWLFNEGSGDKVYDLSGNGKNITLYGPTWSPGNFGSCLSYDGSDDYSESALITTQKTNITMVVWVYYKEGATADHQNIFYNGDPSSNGYGLYIHYAEDKLSILLGGIAFTDNVALTANTWTHLALVESGGTFYLYKNGIYTGTSVTSTANTPTTSSLIGGRVSSNDILNGLIDIPSFFNRALSASEIAQLYREPFCMFERVPIELWSAATLGAAPPVGMAAAMTTNTGYWGW